MKNEFLKKSDALNSEGLLLIVLFSGKDEEVKEIPSKEMKSEAKFYFLKWLEQKLNEIRLIG